MTAIKLFYTAFATGKIFLLCSLFNNASSIKFL